MPRKLRVEYPGAIYHVMSRRNQRQKIVRPHNDRLFFLATLGWKADDLKMRPKGDPDKASIGRRLREETTITLQCIAERLRWAPLDMPSLQSESFDRTFERRSPQG